MKNISETEMLSAQLAALSAEKNELMAKIKEYEKLLEKPPEFVSQYAEKIGAVFYQFSLGLDKIEYINSVAEKLCGKTRQKLYADPQLWFECIHPDDREAVMDTLSKMVKENKNEVLLEYRIKEKEGSILYMVDRAVLAKNYQGTPVAIIGIATDMSEYIKVKKHMFLFHQILHIFETEKKLEKALDSILKITCYFFSWDQSEVWLLDRAKESLFCIKLWSKDFEAIEDFHEKLYRLMTKPNEDFQGEVFQKSSPIFLKDLAHHQKYYRGKFAKKAGLKTALGLPIKYQDKVLGVINYFGKETKSLPEDEMRAMVQISDILGHLIQHNLSDEHLQFITHHDELTGLPNRAGLEEFLEETLLKSQDNLIAIIIVDLDKFKKINESMGFDVGDSLLKEIALKFKEYLSEDAFEKIANIGGDRYAFVSKKLNRSDEVAPLIEHILSVVQTPLVIKGQPLLLKASIGVSIYPYDGLDVLGLLQNADIALNQAKANGGDNVQYFSETLQKEVKRAIKLENDLRSAIAKNEFKLYYQPKIDLKTGNMIGAEALLRWQKAGEGLLLPEDFIPIAEDSDLIVYIGEWVLLEVCHHFPLADIHMPIAVNLSARQLNVKYDMVTFMKKLSDNLSLPPNLLELEVTESQLIEDPLRSMNVLKALRQMGISIALDDFGTGYSSLKYLKQFRPDRIKIDKSFIEDLPHDQESAGIVKAMITLAHGLGMKIIAEGVETAEQLKFLIQENCDEAQGFYFANPMPLYEFRNLILRKQKFVFP